LRINILKMAESYNSEETYKLHQDEYNMLIGLVAEAKSLSFLGSEVFIFKKHKNLQKWRKYMTIVFVWLAILTSIYWAWISSSVFTECSGEGAVCFIFSIIMITSPIRFSIPIFIIFIFAFECDVIIGKIKIFHQMHYGDVNVSHVCALLEHNIRNRKYFASCWQLVFLTSFIIPQILIIAVFAATLSDESIVSNEWFFLIYCVHYCLIGLLAFFKASEVSENSFDIRILLLSNTAKCEVKYIGEKEQVKAYFGYLEKCYNGFQVFGFTINKQKLTEFIVLFGTILGWLSDNVVRK